MNEYRIVKAIEEVGEITADGVHLAIGIFDGVHLGHRKVIGEAKKNAGEGGLTAVLTFHPHASHVLTPEKKVKMIISQEKKFELLKELGVGLIIEQPFTMEFAKTEAEDFLPMLVKHIKNLKGIYVGENFRFGHKRAGDVELLKKQGKELGVKVYIQKGVIEEGEVISSSRIRKLLEGGKVEEARRLLGYEYGG